MTQPSSQPSAPLRIAVLCSGGLGWQSLNQLARTRHVVAVLTDRKSANIIELCQKQGIPYFAGNPRGGKGIEFLRDIEVDVLVSVNYLFLVEQDIIDCPKQMAFNVHGSLLPKYRGRTPHVWAIINNEQEVGITAHLITKECDAGDILEQVRILVEPDDTGATILDKYATEYLPLIDRVLDQVAQGSVSVTPQEHALATYFGKRTPNDGRIDWSWQRERIRNWVRAQAAPYPGAFSYYNGKHVTIDRVSFHSLGFEQTIADGTILSSVPDVVVKTPNGALKLDVVREPIRFEPNTCFDSE